MVPTCAESGWSVIPIDYVPGSHGHFLAFVCNRFLTDIPRTLLGDSPLTAQGTSHGGLDSYWQSRIFREAHYMLGHSHYLAPAHENPSLEQWHGRVIRIWYDRDDLLTLTATCFLRAGDIGIDIDQLHIDTYGQLDNTLFGSVLAELQRLSAENLTRSIQDVRDDTWPLVASWADWDALPTAIKQECEQQHQMYLWRLDAQHRDCPRWVLREYFRESFRPQATNGFLALRDRMIYHDGCDIFDWHFRDFFDTEAFEYAVDRLAGWLGTCCRDNDSMMSLHKDFLRRHRYRDLHQRCQLLWQKWQQRQDHDLSALTLIEQAWLECQIETEIGRSLHQHSVQSWQSFDQIRRMLA